MSEDRLIRIENHMIESAKQLATLTAEQKATNEKLDTVISSNLEQSKKVDKLYDIKNKVIGAVGILGATSGGAWAAFTHLFKS